MTEHFFQLTGFSLDKATIGETLLERDEAMSQMGGGSDGGYAALAEIR